MPLFDFLKSNDENFFRWFEDAANNTLRAATALRDLCYNFRDIQGTVSRLHEYEHFGDEIGHEMYEKLNKAFVTPLDREDIIHLYTSIDDMTDLVHSAADMMATYKVDSVPQAGRELADCIVGCAQEVATALPHLRRRKELSQIQPAIININSFENQADEVLRAGLVELFSHPQDTVHIIKWRDIYGEMEEATDKAEDIADVLRGLVIKHA